MTIIQAKQGKCATKAYESTHNTSKAYLQTHFINLKDADGLIFFPKIVVCPRFLFIALI